MPIDPSATVAATARIHPEACIGPGVRIGEFCVIESDVTIGAGCMLEPYVFIKRWTTLGERNEISAGTVLGTDPFDKKFTGERSYLSIGNDNKIREHYTISRGTAARIGHRDRRRQLHHELGPHCPQLQDRQPDRDRELRPDGGLCGGGGRGLHLGRRGGASVYENRQAGHDRRQQRDQYATRRHFSSMPGFERRRWG